MSRREALLVDSPLTCMTHAPVQHRDLMPPWCESCGREEGCVRLDRHEHGIAWGCSEVAHDTRGWCGSCPLHTLAQEVAAWRVRAMGEGE